MTAFDPANALSTRTRAIAEGAILVMAQKARELKASGADVLSLTLGEPDFDTPQMIRQAASDAMNSGHTHYVPVAGIAPLRQAIADKLHKENAIPASAENVVLANGAKQALTNICFATLDEGDEVLLLAPFWNAYEGIVRMAGGTPVVVSGDASTGFKAPIERISAAMNARTKLVFLNSPSNPSGAVWTGQELEALCGLITAHPSCMLVCDEIYEHIWFDEKPISAAALPGMFERTVTINGFSKAFAMTGWRVGYACAPEPVAKAMAKVQGTFTAGGNAFAQHGAVEALARTHPEVEAMRASYKARRDLAVDMLRAIEGVEIAPPPATFYLLPDISALLGKSDGNHRLETDEDFCHWLLEKAHVATVPGSAFGAPGCMRLSIATDETTIRTALSRISDAVSRLA